MPRYKTKFIVELETANLLNERWIKGRFEQWQKRIDDGIKVNVPIEPIWEEIESDAGN